MSPSQWGLLIAIASHEKAYTSISAMVKYGLGTPQNVTKNKELMQRKDLVEATPDGFTFLDPVFENWFISEYLNWEFRYLDNLNILLKLPLILMIKFESYGNRR